MKNLNDIVLNEIYTIADNLIEISFQNNDSATWMNIVSGSDSDKSFTFIGESNFSLLNGVLGDAIFFFAFSKKVSDDKYYEFAGKIYKSFLTYLENIDLENIDTGLLTGLGGVIYSMTILYEITLDSKNLYDLERFLRKVNISKLIVDDTYNSIVRGNAGLVISLCKYHKHCYDKKKNLNLINDCCNKLIALSKSTSNHLFWFSQHHEKPLAGIAHGSSGYALAFHEAYIITKNTAYLEIVKKSILFENTLFDKETNNWVDNRDFVPNEMKGNTVAWSHGAPGIGLVRNKLLKSEQYDLEFNKLLLDDINLSISKTIQYNFDNNKDILIYGNLGNIDLLINTFQHKEIVNQLESLIRKSTKEGWDYGYKLKRFYKPGFFNGSSGIGYQLLRFLDSETHSILSFE
jgi:lantibiotic modifying enzyme